MTVSLLQRGGKRPGAGRKAVLTTSEMLRIGSACERLWYWLSGQDRRPYYWKPYVLVASAVHFTRVLDRFISTRRIDAAWKYSRALKIDRAQPGVAAYEDAVQIDNWMGARFEKGPIVGEILGLNLSQLSAISTEF